MNMKRIVSLFLALVVLFSFSYGLMAAQTGDAAKHTGFTAADAGGSITVTFRLIGDTLHGGGTAGHTKYVNWIATRSYTFASNDVSVYDVFTRALDGALLKYAGAEKNYVTTINAPAKYGGFELGEFSNGKNSGWMYTIGDGHPGYGLKEKKVADGDVIVWHYVDDYIRETSFQGSTPLYLNRWLEAEDVEPAYITAAIAIYELPAIVTLEDKAAIEAARASYDALNATDKGYIPANRLAKLRAAETALKILEGGPLARIEDMKDIPAQAWYHEDAAYVLTNGIMKGTSATTFGPDDPITRGQFVTILGRYAGIADSGSAAPAQTKFSDVKASAYYASHVAWAVENGITKGTGATAFAPEAKISRQDMATMIARFAETMEIDLPDGSGAAPFSDDKEISSYAKTAVYSMVKAEIINGVGNNRFAPKDSSTRSQAARIIHLLMEYKK